MPLSALSKFVKLAFGYEQWETFDTLADGTLELLRERDDARSLADAKTLQVMLAMEPFFSGGKKIKKGVSSTDSGGGDAAAQGQGKGGFRLGETATRQVHQLLTRLATREAFVVDTVVVFRSPRMFLQNLFVCLLGSH